MKNKKLIPYTAVVTGADNSTGIALIEVYEIDHD